MSAERLTTGMLESLRVAALNGGVILPVASIPMIDELLERRAQHPPVAPKSAQLAPAPHAHHNNAKRGRR